MTRVELLEAVDLIRGAVMMCYPMGLPEWDPVRCLLENRDAVTESVPSDHALHLPTVLPVDQYGYEQHEVEEISLWFAGKEMRVGHPLKAHLGDKEQTTAIIRLIQADRGAPSREPVPIAAPVMSHTSCLGHR